MKRFLLRSLLGTMLVSGSVTAVAQTNENFNTRPSVPSNLIKGHLQDQCWAFTGFEINDHAWSPAIEGDGAMVSRNHPDQSYIYTPVLAMNSPVWLSFGYKFHNNISAGARRWMTIYLADANNNPVMLLDSVEFKNINKNKAYTYSAGLEVNGNYRLRIGYGGLEEGPWVGIDDIKISSSKYYAGGCNTSPIAVNDDLPGSSNRSASGVVITNDSDPNGDQFSAYLVTPSPDGNVILNTNGTFTFTPTIWNADNLNIIAWEIEATEASAGNFTITSLENGSEYNLLINGSRWNTFVVSEQGTLTFDYPEIQNNIFALVRGGTGG